MYSNDATKIVWELDGEKELRPKSNGKSQHISGFCCSCHGFFANEYGQATFKIITPGKNNDGYWTNADLVAQLNVVMPLFEQAHPHAQLLFTFDNSQNHHARAPGCLNAHALNKSDGGKNVQLQHEMEGTWYQGKHYVLHKLVTDRDGNVQKVQKGCASILTDRGIQPIMSLEAMRNILASHDDFRDEPEWLYKTVTDRGHAIIFLPKFHCELNYIEMVWAYVKNALRRNCTFSFVNLKAVLPQVLLDAPIPAFKRFERHCLRYMSGYRTHDLRGPLLDYIMKKFKSHRRIPETLTVELIDKYAVEMKVKLENKRGGTK